MECTVYPTGFRLLIALVCVSSQSSGIRCSQSEHNAAMKRPTNAVRLPAAQILVLGKPGFLLTQVDSQSVSIEDHCVAKQFMLVLSTKALYCHFFDKNVR